MRPLFALHKDADGKTLGAGSFEDDYHLGQWIRKLDLRDGDTITFGETHERPAFAEVEPYRPAFLDQAPNPPALEPVPAAAENDELQPF